MKHLAKSVVRSVSPALYKKIRNLRLLYLLGERGDSYLVTSGFMRSHELGHPCKQDGAPLPWMNYAVIAFLEERLHKDMTLFEYGSGYSTLFYSRLVQRVVSVEHDKTWYEAVRNMTGSNVHLLYQPLEFDGEYCRLINQQNEKFDVVVIDGRDRVRCAINSYQSLSERGIVVFDDSEREKYSDGSRFYLANGFKKIDFESLKFKGFGLGRTAIFYRSHNCLGI